jgi:Fur family peroxide stress response transcriptional regulator
MRKITNMERLKETLETKGLKPTYQRLKILEYLEAHVDSHPTVEAIYEALVKKIPTMSMTTIYNTLNTFIEKSLVSAVTITGTELRYDSVTAPHHHFLCKKCGTILDVEVKCPIIDRDHVSGHQIDEIHGYLKGICKDCLARKRAKK